MLKNRLIEIGRRWLDRYFEQLDSLRHHGIKGQKWGVKNGPPYPLQETKHPYKTLKNAAGQDIIIVDRIELTGIPNSITQISRKGGGIERNYYDINGLQIKQISNNNHGKPKQHPYGKHGEHAHDYIYNDSGTLTNRTIRELTDSERKENGDIL